MKLFSIISNIISYIERVIPKITYSQITQLYYFLRYPFFIGGIKFYCPICNKYFRKFLPKANEINRQNVLCPRDGSFERHRLIWLYLKNRTKFFFDNLNVLHFAPLYCFQKIFKNLPNLNYISADLDSPLAMVKLDITKVKFSDNSFDVIICNHVLEHVLDDRKAMKELYRVLKIGGYAIITCPVDNKRIKTFEDNKIQTSQDRKYFYGQEDHVRIYGVDFKERLKNAGFIVKLEDYSKNLKNNTIKKYGLSKNEIIYLCFK